MLVKELHLVYTSQNTFEVRELVTDQLLGHIRYGLTEYGQPDAYVFTPLDGDPTPGSSSVLAALHRYYGLDVDLSYAPLIL